jgi:CBS-domain-containing membrane protein
MNLDRNRIIQDEDTLLDVAHKFQETPYRRLPVLHGTKLAGQVSRRDVLRAEHRLATEVQERSTKRGADPRLQDVANHKTVGQYMDEHALTASPNCDMLSIAQMFLNSPYRRLPILDGDRLVGQVSRRDLLEAAASVLRPRPERHEVHPLYLSPLSEVAPPSIG